MTSNSEFFLVFDTNILFQNYENKGDFSKFNFNKRFDDTISLINQLDIYEQVTILVPEVSWREMEQQIVDAHTSKAHEAKRIFENYVFPDLSLNEIETDDYRELVKRNIDAYKQSLDKGINTIAELSLPSDVCFKNIMQRAFDKKPPFEGKEKKSDKGFKDVLIWESILEHARRHNKANYLYFCNDKGFKNDLLGEFQTDFPQSSLTIVSRIEDVKQQLENWAKEIDKYSYHPADFSEENRSLTEWLYSSDFVVQIMDFDLLDNDKQSGSRYIKVIDVNDIQEINSNEEYIDYSVNLELAVRYDTKDAGAVGEDVISVVVDIRYVVDELYSVERIQVID